MKTEFPEKWYIIATKENYRTLEKWRKSVANSSWNDFRVGNILLSKHENDSSYYYSDSLEAFKNKSYYSDYKEITFEQFKQHVLKQTEMKKQTLTRKQLITLHNADSCSEWKSEIENILKQNVLADKIEIPVDSLEKLKSRGSETQKKLVADLKIELPKSEKEQYVENQAKCGLQIGDTVTVTRAAKTDENGWDNSWGGIMDNAVGKALKIIGISNYGGMLLEDGKYYPYFILEKVVEEWIPFDFSDDLLGKHVIAKDGSCKAVITYQNTEGVFLANFKFTIEYSYLLETYTFLDGSPCGKLKQ